MPIVILWFGLSELGKYFLVFYGVFFTVWIAAHLGVQRVDEKLVRAARSLGTPESRMMQEVLLPGALPYIFVGLRTSVSISFYTLVAAELAGTFAGLAYRIDIAMQNLQMAQMMGGLVMLGLISADGRQGLLQLRAAGRMVELMRDMPTVPAATASAPARGAVDIDRMSIVFGDRQKRIHRRRPRQRAHRRRANSSASSGRPAAASPR